MVCTHNVSFYLFYSADYVRERISRVYTFGSPPVARLAKSALIDDDNRRAKKQKAKNYECEILNAFNLPSTLVYGFVQPYVSILIENVLSEM